MTWRNVGARGLITACIPGVCRAPLTDIDSDALSPSSGILTDIQVPHTVARERTSAT